MVQAGTRARAGARRRRPGCPSGTCGPGRARAPGSSSTPRARGPPRRFDGGANIWGRAEVSGLGRGARGPARDLHETGAGAHCRPPGAPARRPGLKWPRAANGQLSPHFKGRAAQSAGPLRGRRCSIYARGRSFWPQRPTLAVPRGSSSGVTFPPRPSPRPLPPRSRPAPSSPASAGSPGAVSGKRPLTRVKVAVA